MNFPYKVCVISTKNLASRNETDHFFFMSFIKKIYIYRTNELFVKENYNFFSLAHNDF